MTYCPYRHSPPSHVREQKAGTFLFKHVVEPEVVLQGFLSGFKLLLNEHETVEEVVIICGAEGCKNLLLAVGALCEILYPFGERFLALVQLPINGFILFTQLGIGKEGANLLGGIKVAVGLERPGQRSLHSAIMRIDNDHRILVLQLYV